MTRARQLSKLANSNILSVDTSNNIGIGSTTPDAKLDVAGEFIVGSGASITTAGEAVFAGVVTATSFSGSGANLTGVGTQALNVQAQSLTVAGISTFADDVRVLAGGLDVVGVITSNNKVVATGLDIGTAGVDIDGQTDLDELVVAGVATFSAAVDISTGGVDIDGQTDLDELQVAGVSTFSANVLVSSAATVGLAKSLSLSDGAFINFGTADDMQIYHSGSHSVITDRGTGSLKIQSSEVSLEDASGSQKLATIGTGITVTGGLNASGLSTFSGFGVTPGECIKETAKVTTTAWNSDTTINISLGNIVYNSGGTGAGGVDLNIVSDVGINTTLKIGEVLTVTGIVSCTNTAHYVDGLQIDHNTVLLSWVGGSAPTEGGGSAFDAYSFTIVKTANAAYSVIANQTKCS